MKIFLRWLYTIILYILVTVVLLFGLSSFIMQTTIAPWSLNNFQIDFGLMLGSGLTAWMAIICITIILMAVVSLLMYGLWNLVMCSALLGKFPTCENAPVFNWMFILLHVLAVSVLAWFMTGQFISEIMKLLSFAQLVVYLFPIIIYTGLFVFTSRAFSPKTCYRFKKMWAVREGLRLM